MKSFLRGILAGMTLMSTSGLLFAQESSGRFFRILGTNQITITNFTDGVMAWAGQSAGAAVMVERSENLTDPDGWQRYTEVPGDELRGSLQVFDHNTPDGMVLIPAGNNSGTDPGYGAYSLAVTNWFFMDAAEVTKAQWDTVYNWAVTNGYSFDNAGSGKAASHPVQRVSWYDCVKWCNARSEREGRTPVYAVSGTVYRSGKSIPTQNMAANGYRLPAVAEWEYAARGGLSGKRFPWGDTIQHSRANYYSSSSYSYDTSSTRGYHPAYATGGTPYTNPADSFPANGYGLYDMSGNVREWCWDLSGASRHFRGGCWSFHAFIASCGYADWAAPDSAYNSVGFRTVCR